MSLEAGVISIKVNIPDTGHIVVWNVILGASVHGSHALGMRKSARSSIKSRLGSPNTAFMKADNLGTACMTKEYMHGGPTQSVPP